MSYLICSNGKITTVEDLANWDTSKVTTMKSMFHSNLTINDLSPISQWDTSSLTDMSFMFYGMKNIEVIDISGWDTRKVNDFSLMFYNDKNLRHIYVGENWDTSANTSTITDIFPDTSYLPNFNNSSSNRKNISYAHTGPGGYLELKPED
jgi:surface protein